MERKVAQIAFKCVQLLFDILQSGYLKILGFDLEDGDLVNEFTKRDRCKKVLDFLFLCCCWRGRCCLNPKVLLELFCHPLHYLIPVAPLFLAEEPHRRIPEGCFSF